MSMSATAGQWTSHTYSVWSAPDTNNVTLCTSSYYIYSRSNIFPGNISHLLKVIFCTLSNIVRIITREDISLQWPVPPFKISFHTIQYIPYQAYIPSILPSQVKKRHKTEYFGQFPIYFGKVARRWKCYHSNYITGLSWAAVLPGVQIIPVPGLSHHGQHHQASLAP